MTTNQMTDLDDETIELFQQRARYREALRDNIRIIDEMLKHGHDAELVQLRERIRQYLFQGDA